LLTPAAHVRSIRRRYRAETLILETDYETDAGAVTLIDFMPPRQGTLDLVRIIEGKHGQVPMHMELVIRFDYGSIVPWVHQHGRGIRATAGPDTLYCRTEVPLHGKDFRTEADFVVSAGERVNFTLTWSPTHEKEPPHRDPAQALNDTEQWWREWSSHCTYDGQWREAVLRSLITLKALTYAPTGGVAAAPTTSLPEKIGGVRNWDYRYCWLRDATFTLYALVGNGYTEEAKAWRQWLVDAVAGTPADVQIMYGLAGERRLTEYEIPWLNGYEGSKPVRVGNDAYRQRQWDVFGETMDALHLARQVDLQLHEDAWHIQRALMGFLETNWHKPDNGIWEFRGPPRQFVHSKVMAWVAMDRAVKAIERHGLEGNLDQWRQTRQAIHEQVCREGFNAKLNSFVQYYGSEIPDASLLMLPLVGFLPIDDPRIVGTVDYIQRTLMRNGFVERYPTSPELDGLPHGENPFLMCTFWLADNLALLGRHTEARDIFERLLSVRNDVGLLSEEYDPQTRRLVGNFPQAFSHVGLVNTARNLLKPGGPAEKRQAH
jgi:GH15 family glucan-1,4-alpha-glucosidase